MKIFNKYVTIAMHVQCNYTDVISLRYKVVLVLQPKLSLKTHFRTRFNNHVTSHMTHKIDELTYSIDRVQFEQYNSYGIRIT